MAPPARTINRFVLALVLPVMGLTSCGGGDATAPDPNAVASVVVSPPSTTITTLGATSQYSAQARNSSGGVVSGKTFTWSSSSSGVATVTTSGGLVTAVAGGTSTIRATMDGSSMSGTAQLTVQQAVASVVIGASNSSVLVSGTLQLSATAKDAGGATVPNATITWASANTNVATVNPATGLVTGVAPGTINITATSSGFSNQKSISVSMPALAIAKDTAISGNLTVDGFSVAPGFTVTVNGPLTLHSGRAISIAGTLTGNCTAFDIVSDTAVTITGNVTNGCGAGLAGAPLRISSTGELILNGALIESSGAITLANNPTLSSGTVFLQKLGALASAAPAQGALPGTPLAQIGNSTIRYSSIGSGPGPAPSGTNGLNGTDATDGRPIEILLNGNVQFTGNTTVWGQDGGIGGTGFNVLPSNATSVGGHGGRGGRLRLIVNGTLAYSGLSNILRSGAGGSGGSATAATTKGAPGAQAPSAIATGGNGRDPGLVEITATGGLTVTQIGSMTIELAAPGNGGVAVAQAADGLDATASSAAQIGGDATANGGDGGSNPSFNLVLPGTIVGTPPNVVGPGGGVVKAGSGGYAKATSGKGGDGLKPNKAGAKGGNLTANAGDGGNPGAVPGAFRGIGGDGGLAWLLRGFGGNGWSDCTMEPYEPGGAGGNGGIASGAEGLGGTGLGGAGMRGGSRFEFVSFGGKGGNGNRGGSGGQFGDNAVTAAGVPVTIGTNFTSGAAGLNCPMPNPKPQVDLYMQLVGSWNENSIGQISPGTRNRQLLTGSGAVAGQVLITSMANSFLPYYIAIVPPPRLGQIGADGWDLNIASVQEGTTFPNIESFTLCFTNENPVPSTSAPIIVQQRDNGGNLTEPARFIVGPEPVEPIGDGRAGCAKFVKNMNTTHVRWFRALNSTTEVDWIGFTKKPPP